MKTFSCAFTISSDGSPREDYWLKSIIVLKLSVCAVKLLSKKESQMVSPHRHGETHRPGLLNMPECLILVKNGGEEREKVSSSLETAERIIIFIISTYLKITCSFLHHLIKPRQSLQLLMTMIQ